jgi:hypothetical protein
MIATYKKLVIGKKHQRGLKRHEDYLKEEHRMKEGLTPLRVLDRFLRASGYLNNNMNFEDHVKSQKFDKIKGLLSL